MSVETQLRDVLHREANRTPADAGDLGEVRRRGRRRRRLRTGAAGVASAAALVLLVVFVGPIARPGPVITPVSGGLDDAALMLCDVRCPMPTDAQLEDLETDLAADPNIASYTFETPEQTRDRFAAALDHRPELVESLDIDSLPPTIGLRVADVVELARYVDRPGVDRVIVSDGLPLPPTPEQITADLRDSDEAGPDLQILHVDVVGQSLVVVAERGATVDEREFSDHARRGLLYTWEPDPDAISTWRPVGGVNAPIGPDGWTATEDLDDGRRIVAWGSVTDPTARIELAGGLLRSPSTHDITAPFGLAVIEGDGDPKIVTD